MIWSHSSRARSCAVDPQAVVALVGTLRLLRRAGLGAVHEFDLAVVLHRLHEGIGHADRDVEVLQVALVLGVDEQLRCPGGRSAARPSARRAGCRRDSTVSQRAVEHAHVAHRARRRCSACCRPRRRAGGCARSRSPRRRRGAWSRRLRSARCRCRDGRLRPCAIESPTGCTKQLISVAAELGAGGRIDAPGRDEAAPLRLQEARFPLGALRRCFDRRQRARHAQRTASIERSSPLAYFSSSTSWLIGCSGRAARVAGFSRVLMGVDFRLLGADSYGGAIRRPSAQTQVVGTVILYSS